MLVNWRFLVVGIGLWMVHVENEAAVFVFGDCNWRPWMRKMPEGYQDFSAD